MTESLKKILKDIGFTEINGDFIGAFFDAHSDCVFKVEAIEGTDPTNGLREYRICTIRDDGSCEVDTSLSIGQFLEDLDRRNIWWIPPVPYRTVTLSIDIDMSPEDVPLEDWASYIDDAGGNVDVALRTAARRALSGLVCNNPNIEIVDGTYRDR